MPDPVIARDDLPQPPTRRKAQLMDLDDRCLLQILKNLVPLPDLFQVALANKRLKSLATGRRLFLYVTPTDADPASPRLTSPTTTTINTSLTSPTLHTPSKAAFSTECQQFPSLEAAVNASRPGDTVLLRSGRHHIPQPICVPWPLQFLGEGEDAGETVLVSPRSNTGTFDFRASGKLKNLTVHAQQHPCVVHRRGALGVVRCQLLCDVDRGLEHTVQPVVTIAHGSAVVEEGSTCHPRQPVVRGPGRVSVEETHILMKGDAVKCAGSGSLQAVRVVYQSRAPLFWFVVDSSHSGGGFSDDCDAVTAAGWTRSSEHIN